MRKSRTIVGISVAALLSLAVTRASPAVAPAVASQLPTPSLPPASLPAGASIDAPAGRRVEFNRDVRPILSENCFFCHGQDPAHREAKLRLDTSEGATRDLGGYAAVVPGKPDESEVVKRLVAHDPDELMPPAKSNRKVSPAQVEVVRRWIAEGAAYQKHWAFQTPVRPPTPAVRQADWPRNDVDRFVLARLEAEGLTPSREATPGKWLRRASLDLIGLPPTPAELDAFLADVTSRGEPAYAAAADRLLASERFGERQAIDWLDVARYADTHGFNNDTTRTMWRWRDWVIGAFNANQPYDRFITEQLAGDQMPFQFGAGDGGAGESAALDRRLATGFGRNHVISSEGGVIDEEYRVEYVADRVRTTSTAWLGLTTECARCHDHKFDPIPQKDYYRFFALFNNVAEHGEDGRVANAVPLIPAPTRAQQERAAALDRGLADLDATLRPARDGWRWGDEPAAAVAEAIMAAVTAAPREASFTVDAETTAPKAKAYSFPTTAPSSVPGVRGNAWVADGAAAVAKLEPTAFVPNGPAGGSVAFWVMTDPGVARDVPLFSSLNHEGNPADTSFGQGIELRLVDGELEFTASERYPVYALRVRTDGADLRPGQWRHVAVAFDVPYPALQRTPWSSVRLFVDGREQPVRILNDGLGGRPGPRSLLVGADNAKGGARWRGAIDEWRAFPKALSADEVRALFAADALPYAVARARVGEATTAELAWLRDAALAAADPVWREAAARREAVRQDRLALARQVPTAMVMAEASSPRKATVLVRGAYDAPGEPVEPGAMESLLVPWPEGAPRNRLGLAQWLTRPDHPLTGRVVVNRLWAQLFGTGIVKTVEDFGSQGEWPSHPELLDRLARDFVDGPHGGAAGRAWDVKALLKTLVLSATYRQDSAVTPALLERDPENRLLARGPRVRLPAELVRDQALAVSGLLKQRLGGPSVFPYQPADLYKGTVVGANYPGTTWPQSAGDDLYRRSLYTFWKRTVPHPAMLTFDAPDREFCTARRSRTNTPLQALTLLNEMGLVEASRALAGRMLKEGGEGDAAKASYAFRLATGRSPTDAEVGVLTRTWARFRAEFAADPKAAEAMLAVGASKPDGSVPPAELAAASVVTSLLLNLDETITKD